MNSKIGFEMSFIVVVVVEAIRGRCASFMILTATVSEIFGGQTNSFSSTRPTRRVPVQRAVERDQLPYPYKVHDTTLRPHNYKIDHSRA